MNNKKKPVGVAANDSSTSGINETYFQNSFITCWSPYWSDSFLFCWGDDKINVEKTHRYVSEYITLHEWIIIQVITLSHTLIHSIQKWSHYVTQVITLYHTRYYIQHRGDNIMSHKDYIITYINTFNTEVITLCHTSDSLSHTLIHSTQKWLHSTQRW